jgi:hypothetical protein
LLEVLTGIVILGRQGRDRKIFEERPTLKRKFLLSLLAVVPAVLMPLAATSQVAPDREAVHAERLNAPLKYEAYAGYGYTSLNQVNQSRHGLQGVELSVTRNWGKYFGLTADGATYQTPTSCCNPGLVTKDGETTLQLKGSPTVQYVLFGPTLHANLYGRLDGFFHVLLGGAHTSDEQMTPKVSFAGGYGVGLDYKINRRFALRAAGDDIMSSFNTTFNNAGASPHEHGNSRATVGVVYKF